MSAEKKNETTLHADNCLDAIGEALSHLSPEERTLFKKQLYEKVESYEQLEALCKATAPEPAVKKQLVMPGVPLKLNKERKNENP